MIDVENNWQDTQTWAVRQVHPESKMLKEVSEIPSLSSLDLTEALLSMWKYIKLGKTEHV